MFMPMDGLMIRTIAKKLNDNLINAKLTKINELSSQVYALSFWKQGSPATLMISLSANQSYIYLDKENREVQHELSHFGSILKTHLLNAKIMNITHYKYDRIIDITFSFINEIFVEVKKHLIIEFIGKFTNMILTKEDYIIIDALKKYSPMDSNPQTILCGMKYESPKLDEKLVPEDYQGNENFDNYTESFYGISPILNQEIQYRIHNLNQNFNDIIKEITSSNDIYFFKNGNKTDFYLIPLLYLNQEQNKENIFEGIKNFYYNKMLQLNYHEATNQIEKVINNNLNKNRLKITKLEEEINGHKRALKNKDYGDLLFTYAYLGKIVKNEFIYEDENIRIPIDPSISIFDNGKKYFAKYSKAKKAIPFIEEQIEIAKIEIDYLENILIQLIDADYSSITQIKEELIKANYINDKKKIMPKKGKKEKVKKYPPLYFESPTGVKIALGKNNLQNEELTFQTANSNDTFFHVKDYAGSHVVVFGNNLDEPTIRFAANLAAYYSKARYSSSVPIDYTLVKHVKKHPSNKPGLVLLKEYKTIYIDPEKI